MGGLFTAATEHSALRDWHRDAVSTCCQDADCSRLHSQRPAAKPNQTQIKRRRTSAAQATAWPSRNRRSTTPRVKRTPTRSSVGVPAPCHTSPCLAYDARGVRHEGRLATTLALAGGGPLQGHQGGGNHPHPGRYFATFTDTFGGVGVHSAKFSLNCPIRKRHRLRIDASVLPYASRHSILRLPLSLLARGRFRGLISESSGRGLLNCLHANNRRAQKFLLFLLALDGR